MFPTEDKLSVQVVAKIKTKNAVCVNTEDYLSRSSFRLIKQP